MTNTRDQFIDFLRFVGLSLIIFAHVGPPNILAQVRNFDVPLMVLVSAFSFALSYKPERSYLSYVWSRIKRLVFPVWIFLTIYFVGLHFIVPEHPALHLNTILTSYTLIEGIGYVWVIRVFLLVALTAPFIYKWHLQKSNFVFFATAIIVYLTYEVCLFITRPYLPSLWWLSILIYYAIPYSLLFALGIKMPVISAKQNLAILLSSLLVLILLGIILFIGNGHFVFTQEYKYPPSAYYLSYAIFMCCALYLWGSYIWNFLQKITLLKQLVLFIARNSLWIYLWHIPFVEFIQLNFVFKYIVVYLGALIIVSAQSYLIKRLLLVITNKKVASNIRMIFTG